MALERQYHYYATRSLKFIVNGIGEVKHDVIMISHSISTIKDCCDMITFLEEQKISSTGSDEFLKVRSSKT